MHQLSKQAAEYLKTYRNVPADEIENAGFGGALSLFKQMAAQVPAYKDFLKKHKVDPEKITSRSDFSQLPILDKKNYLTAYKLSDLCWNGDLSPLSVISSSSGSTGKSFLWPRGLDQELEGRLILELMFKNFFNIDQKKTLYINCFSMGTWVAGTYVLSSVEQLSWQGYPIISVAPGIEKQLALQLFDDLAGQFDQVIFGGYPPFIKDLLDEGVQSGINWKEYSIRFLFAAEGFSKQWRSHIHNLVGATNPYTTSINIYGSADATILAHETPLTNAIRQHIDNEPGAQEKIYGMPRLATLAQYDPRLRFFEVDQSQLIFSARAGLPLLRYAIGDNGGQRSFRQMYELVSQTGYNWYSDDAVNSQTWNLPFVWVFGRKNLAASLYGILIYPEYIRHGLENEAIADLVTGKFVMSTELDDQKNQYLSILVELIQPSNASPKQQRVVSGNIISALKTQSSEYRRLVEAIGDRATPKITLTPKGSKEFAIGSKHRWVKKS